MVHRLRKAMNKFGFDVRPRRDVHLRLIGADLRFRHADTGIVGEIVAFNLDGSRLSLFIENEADHIQAFHKQGKLYEAEELKIIGRHFTGGTFVDVGANIGNHAIYALKFLNADHVIAIEPNPAAYRILHVNIGLNGLGQKLEHLAVGLAEKPGRASFSTPSHNLGGTRLTVDQEGPFEVTTGDALLKDRQVNFLKIDTEGLELAVLDGLKQTIADKQPIMFVEVEEKNTAAFCARMAEIGYGIAERFRRYPESENYLVRPN